VNNDNQFGFRSKHSTTLATLELINTYQNLDKKEMVICIYLNLKKASDTVDHNILLSEMYIYGIRGTTLEWFKSYLQNRQQYTVVNDCKSWWDKISHGYHKGQ